MTRARAGAWCALMTMVAATAVADSISGSVVTEAGAPAVGVDVALFAPDGTPATSGLHLTDSDGHYFLTVRAGSYDIEYRSGGASPLTSRRVRNAQVAGATGRLPVALPRGVRLSGRVVDDAGAAVQGARVRCVDSATGEEWLVFSNRTSADGTYAVTIPAGTWEVVHEPPPGSVLARAVAHLVEVASPLTRPDVRLARALSLDVIVRDGAGGPVFGASVSAIDAEAPALGPAAAGVSDAAGHAILAVPAGAWNVVARSPLDRPLVAASIADVKVLGPSSLDVRLAPGRYVSGRVASAGVGLAGASIRWCSRAGVELALPVTTNASGLFGAVLPDGEYCAAVDPPRAAHAGAVIVDGLTVSGDTLIPDFALPPARVLVGRARDASGRPVADAPTRVTDVATGEPVLTANGRTDRFGDFVLSLPAGTFDVDILPGVETGLAAARERVSATGPDARIAVTVLPDGVLVTGRVTDGSGRGLAGARLELRDATTGDSIPLAGGETDVSGGFTVRMIAGARTMRIVPPAPWLERVIQVAPTYDMALSDVTLAAGSTIAGRVVDDRGEPLRGVAVAFVSVAGNGAPSAVRRTDGTGTFAVGLEPGPVQLRLVPPSASGLAPGTKTFVVAGGADLGALALSSGDMDGDGWSDTLESCPGAFDVAQADADADGLGDACDDCRVVADPSQADANRDGIADACSFTWGDLSPAGAPDGRIDVGDVVRALRLSVGLEQATPLTLLRANVAPATVVGTGPEVVTPTLSMPQVVDVADVVTLLRAAVGQAVFTPPR